MLTSLGINAKKASRSLMSTGTAQKNAALLLMAAAIEENAQAIMAQNAVDIKNAEENGMNPSLIDRLKLDESRITSIAGAIRQIVSFDDPVGRFSAERQDRTA